MTINTKKAKVMHLRVERSQYVVGGCGSNIEYTERYRYLGLVLTEHMNYNITATYVANSATRALRR